MEDIIVSLAIEKLTSFIAEEVSFLQGVRRETEWLRDELQTIRSFLKDADNKQGGDNRIRQWVSDIREVSYDAVDILDSFTTQFEEEKSQEPCFIGCLQGCASICKKPTNLHNIGKEIESIKTRLAAISRRRLDYGITNIGHPGEGTSSGPRPISLRRTTSSFKDHVIGFEDVANTLLSQLLKEGSSRSIVSIYGMGGLGKTTLARKLYNSLNVSEHFDDYKAWICVSQEYNIKDLLRSVIESFQRRLEKEEIDKLGSMSEDDLKRHLRNILEGHRYLVVVDDVWHEDAFKALSDAFPDNTNGSKIIITTRKEEVAKRADKQSFVHRLRFLTPTESWDLFRKEAFQGDRGVDSCTPAMMSMAEEMVNKCGGLPLAIVVLAGLLCYKYGLEEWLKVQEDIWLHLKKDNMEISELLTLSYNDLSLEIKQCFLYIGMFPEDYVIPVPTFIRLLIAEGFIPSHGNETMEDMANEFVNELIGRNLIQVVKTYWEQPVAFKVHDLLRDLAIEKANEVNLFSIVDSRKPNSISAKARRYAIHSQGNKFLLLDHSNRTIRTLVFFPDDIRIAKGTFTRREYKLLRVLDLWYVFLRESKETSKAICKLIHLRFLGLRASNLHKLLASIGKLQRLQTLQLAPAGPPSRLPMEVCKLKELRHLIGDFKGHMHIESLTNLRTLCVLDSQGFSNLPSGNLRNLQELGVDFENDSSSLNLITSLDNLRSLLVRWNSAPPSLEPLFYCKQLLKLELDGPIVKDPSLKEFPPLLTRLILRRSELMNDPMPVLERLPNLRSLELWKAYEGRKMVCSSTGFRQLEVLRIARLHKLEEWEVEQGAMPRLKGLCIEECDKLRMIPENLKWVHTDGPSVNPLPFHNRGMFWWH